MKLILDPIVFCFDPGSDKKAQFAAVKVALDQINLVIKGYGARVTLGYDEWKNFRKEYIAPFLLFFNDPTLRAAWLTIEKTFIPAQDPLVPQITGWGTSQLFGMSLLGRDPWANVIAKAAVSWILKGERVVFFCKLVLGRNLEHHGAGHAILGVKTRWTLYFAAEGTPGATAVDCISSVRNMQVPWTIRYDDRLPARAPNGGLAFEPAPGWRKGKQVVFGTGSSKATWFDTYGNAWAKPSPPNQAHHWDVYLNDLATKKRFPVNPINITCWNTEDRGRSEGQIHHFQKAQQHRLGK